MNLASVFRPDDSSGTDGPDFVKRKFEPENIVIVTDGFCSSTCTIFSEFMRQQARIKTINLGGRPNMDITQAVGGVKGTQSLRSDEILDWVQVPFRYGYIHMAEFYNKTALGDYDNLLLYRTIYKGLNVRDGYREDDLCNIPLQFKYEPADCRMFYTPEMAVDMTAA